MDVKKCMKVTCNYDATELSDLQFAESLKEVHKK